ncbi:MAG: DMT family transporter [Hyphomicrobiaceae bacterium]|nr:DMT family transporter [Hyphomicrobiaceae bacterium]
MEKRAPDDTNADEAASSRAVRRVRRWIAAGGRGAGGEVPVVSRTPFIATSPAGNAANLATEPPTLAGAHAGDPVRAAIWVTISMALLAGIASLVRYAALSGLDASVTLFWRNLFCVVWMLPLLAFRGRSLMATAQPRLYVLRVAISFLSMSAFFHALSLIPIGEATAISFLSPLFGTLFAILLLGEVVGPRRWIALVIGFVGALIILRPWAGVTIVPGHENALGVGQLAALLSAMCVGIIGPLVKQLTNADDADRIVFITSLLLTPVSLVPALFVWQWPNSEQWIVLLALGLLAVLGHMTLVRGYVAAEASLVMTFKFSRLPFAVAIGYLAFGETIDAETWLGAGVIFAAGVYIVRREAALRSQARRAGAAADLPSPPPQPPL